MCVVCVCVVCVYAHGGWWVPVVDAGWARVVGTVAIKLVVAI